MSRVDVKLLTMTIFSFVARRAFSNASSTTTFPEFWVAGMVRFSGRTGLIAA